MSDVSDALLKAHKEIAALKAERDNWKRRCNDYRIARDSLEKDNDRLVAALEEMLIIKPRDEAEAAFHRIARRALEGK